MTVELQRRLSTMVIHTCGYLSVHCGQECAQHAGHDDVFSVDHVAEWEVTPLLAAAKCSGGCYCVKDRFVWRCTVCGHLC